MVSKLYYREVFYSPNSWKKVNNIINTVVYIFLNDLDPMEARIIILFALRKILFPTILFNRTIIYI
jgi:hypothetical protein